MADLADLPADSPDNAIPQCRLGGGNPAQIPQMTQVFAQHAKAYADNLARISASSTKYSSPQGHKPFIKSLAKLLHQKYDWPVTEKNIALTNGSQNAFFMLFNLFGGRRGQDHKQILLPMAPEYMGYEDVSIGESIFVSNRPIIEKLDEQLFKYRVDLENLTVSADISAICVSRPTNPTGNVITDHELDCLDTLARQHEIPLIIDNAYGAPFPNIINVPSTLKWHENIVLSMSLSKLGVPGARTGIVVAHPDVINALSEMNAVMNLCPVAVWADMLEPMFADSSVLSLCEQHVQPFYKKRSEDALDWFRQSFHGLPALAHKPEGAIFLWVWFPELTIHSAELYQRLKSQGVIVVPGHYFFPGLDEDWDHKRQCIRINICGDESEIKQGFDLIANEIRKVS